MPVLTLLTAVGRLVGHPKPDQGDCLYLRASSGRVLFLALQSALREQLRVCVHEPSTRRVRQLMTQAAVLLGEIERREAAGDAVDLEMLQASGGAGRDRSLAQWCRVQASLTAAIRHSLLWRRNGRNAPRKAAAQLATHLQDTVCVLLEYAGRADADDPRQVEWLELVANPMRADLSCDAQAAALIGAALWLSAGNGRLRAWQLLAWRLWSMPPKQLASLFGPGKSWWRRNKPENQCPGAAAALLATGVVTAGAKSAYFLRPRREAAAGCLAILQAKRYDTEEAVRVRRLLPIAPGNLPASLLGSFSDLNQQNHPGWQSGPQA